MGDQASADMAQAEYEWGAHGPGYWDQFDNDHDQAEIDSMDRFQTPDNGLPYRVTVDYDAATPTEARLYADLIRAAVRRNEFRVPCKACGGSRWVPSLPSAADVVIFSSPNHGPVRRCTACTDGTEVENPAVVTFEAPAEVGSEATYVPAELTARLLSEGQERRRAESLKETR